MKKTLIASALIAAFAAPAFAADAAPAEHTVTGNFGVFSSYRFRGIDQTFGKPAIQGGVDYSHSSGLYLGNWNSNVSSGAGYPNGNLEMDFYGGYKTTFGDIGVDVGALYYYYPGSKATGVNTAKSGAVSNTELYVGASWKFLSLKYSRAISDYFEAADSKGTSYLDLSATYDLGNGWGVNGHIGHLNFKNSTANYNYTDYKVGVTKELGAGWVAGLSYVTTNAKASAYSMTNSWSYDGTANTTGDKSKDLSRGITVLSVSKTF